MWTVALAVALAQAPDDGAGAAPDPDADPRPAWDVPAHFDAPMLFRRPALDGDALPSAEPGPRRLRPWVVAGFTVGVAAGLWLTFPVSWALATTTDVQ